MSYTLPTQPLIQQNWHELLQRIAAAGIDMVQAGASHANAELKKLQKLMRNFVMDLAERQPGQTIYGGNEAYALDFTRSLNLRGKTYNSKQDFLAAHRHDGEWAEDVMLLFGLNQLGINVNYEVRSRRYPSAMGISQPYNIENPVDTITLVNDADAGHWTLGDLPNIAGGNCGFYAVSQAITQLWPKMGQAISITSITAQDAKPAIEPVTVANDAHQVDPVYLTVKNKQHFIETDQQDVSRFNQATTWLNGKDLKTLVDIYHYACKNLADGDTYLARRPHFVAQEYGFDLLGHTLATGKVENANTAVLAHAELVHMLATECKRSPMAYLQLEHFIKPQQQSCAKEAAPLPISLQQTLTVR